MAAKTDLSQFNCSLARALNSVGDGWSLLIIRDAFLGLVRFSEFQKSTGIARNILADRLEVLVAADILTRRGSEKRPLYRLTKKGHALLPALVALMQWGDHWESGDCPPIAVRDCDGAAVLPVRVESLSGETVTAQTIRFTAGPGANARTAGFLAGARESKH
jgi:DNA-binding HxlR family transcriptional regulator